MSPVPSSTGRARLESSTLKPKRMQKQERGRKPTSVKRGRPSKLTDSGKRKLARLYTYTNLSAEQMCGVLEKFNGIQISTRTVQNRIQEVLHTDLKSTRPQDRRVCRARMRTMQRYKVMALSQRSDNNGYSLKASTPSMPLSNSPFSNHTSRTKFSGLNVDSPAEVIPGGETVPTYCIDPWLFVNSQNTFLAPIATESPSSEDAEPSIALGASKDAPLPDLESPPELVPGGETSSTHGLDLGLLEGFQDIFQAPVATESPFLEDAESSIALETSKVISPPDLEKVLTKPSEQVAQPDTPEPEPAAIQNSRTYSPTTQTFQFEPNWGNTAEDVDSNHCPIGSSVGSDVIATIWPGHLQTTSSERDSVTATFDHHRPDSPYPYNSCDPSRSALPDFATDPFQYEAEYDKIATSGRARLSTDLVPSDYQQGVKRPISTSSSVVSGASRSRQKIGSPTSFLNQETAIALPGVETLSTGKRGSWAPSFRSISSSQRADIITIIRRFSSSSEGTKCSSTFTLASEQVDEAPRPQAVSLEDMYAMKRPVKLPGDLITSHVDTLKEHESCDSFCLWGQPSHWCDFCTRKTIFNAALGDIKRCWQWNYERLAGMELDGRDRFSNTPLHVAAAAGAGYEILNVLIARGASLDLVNTAGQTFMHVLDPATLASSGRLPRFLREIADLKFDFFKQDHQGSNTLQALLQHQLHHDVMRAIFKVLRYKLPVLASRDNLGRSVPSRLLNLAQSASGSEPERTETINQLLSEYYQIDPIFFNASAFDRGSLVCSKEGVRTLEGTVSRSLKEPAFEDSYGRNGLHCLAQLYIERPKQRFRDKFWGRAPANVHRTSSPRHQPQGNEVSDVHFSDLLSAGVDPMTYDKSGNTPLLALLCYNAYSEKDSDAILKKRVTDLIKAGASVYSRDRNGETPLHVAVKRGIITATRILVESGANLHARQKNGKGVVQLGLGTAHEMRAYKSLQIRIMTCINLVKERGAVDSPTIFQEWDCQLPAV